MADGNKRICDLSSFLLFSCVVSSIHLQLFDSLILEDKSSSFERMSLHPADFHRVALIRRFKLLFSRQQPFPSLPTATPQRQGFLASEECHSRVIHCAHCGLSFQTECVCVCERQTTEQYKSTEGSLVSGLMEEWMTNKNSEMPFIVAS